MVMEVKHLNIEDIPMFKKPLAIALGYFDGLHKGHMDLINKTLESAKNNDLASAVITFNPNPLITLGKIKEEQLLTTIEDRQIILEELGVDYFIILKFSKEIANLSPEEFIIKLIKPMQVKAIICGFDYYFGRRNQGNASTLIALSEGDYEVSIVEQVCDHKEKISSTRIVSLLKEGSIEEANYLLNRIFSLKGVVIEGRKIGKELGFPTANIDYKPYVLPKNGVYATKVIVRGIEYLGMCNIGRNPTVGALDDLSVEVFIFDFNDEIYGEIITVSFYHFIREEVKFETKKQLIEQLHKDEETIINWFKDNK